MQIFLYRLLRQYIRSSNFMMANQTLNPMLFRIFSLVVIGFIAIFFAGCSSTATPPSVLPLSGSITPLLAVKQVWTTELGRLQGASALVVADGRLAVTQLDGAIAVISPDTGAVHWRSSPSGKALAGAGFDGRVSAVPIFGNELLVTLEGKVLWKKQLNSQIFTPPLVAGQRVFVLAADRSVSAFDALTGAKLWSQTRNGEPLVLRHPGLLASAKEMLLVGVGGRLAALNPDSGATRWEVGIGNSRGTNEIERMIDLSGGGSRFGDSFCARAFQSAIACVDVDSGLLVWRKAADGFQGLTGNERMVIGIESDGTMIAWSRKDGSKLWSSYALKGRRPSAPLLVGKTVIVGDAGGSVHFFSTEDGAVVNRVNTDGTPIEVAPIVVGRTIVVGTSGGRILAFRPE
jgi:outer membrane protein assembly factor BamB